MSEGPIIIHAENLTATLKKLRFPEKAINKVMKRALSKTARWAGRQAIKLINKSTKISSRVLKGRMKLDISSAEHGHASIWVGLNPVGLHRLSPRQTGSGIKAGPASVRGGFMAKEKVFKRRGKARLPIVLQKFDIYPQASEALKELAQEVEEKLQENFDQAYEDIIYK